MKMNQNNDLHTLQKQAQEGRERAQYELAKHHIEQRDYAAAVYWLQKAANQGFILAANQLQDVINNGMRRK